MPIAKATEVKEETLIVKSKTIVNARDLREAIKGIEGDLTMSRIRFSCRTDQRKG
jgi:hypothetical protein